MTYGFGEETTRVGDERHAWSSVLAALYLADTPHAMAIDRRRWRAVVGALRIADSSLESAATDLRRAGLIFEATALESTGSLAWGEAQVSANSVLDVLDSAYPRRLVGVLGEAAPPVFWKRSGPLSAAPPSRAIGVVGSRRVDPEVHRYCAEVAREAVRMGFRVVSGGASGCDQAALGAVARVHGSSLSILPYGISLAEECPPPGQTLLSLCAPAEPFSTGRAMERNSLIYAASEACVVGEVRFQTGGTWHGACSALRKRLCQILVRPPDSGDSDESRRGARALKSLGAEFLSDPMDLEGALEQIEGEAMLFEFRGFRAG
jgi:predicted Rossmann fold nucleotide-binding protein DprA/Smf involved in DNA uptake